jgi:hypothetical protein
MHGITSHTGSQVPATVVLLVVARGFGGRSRAASTRLRSDTEAGTCDGATDTISALIGEIKIKD